MHKASLTLIDRTWYKETLTWHFGFIRLQASVCVCGTLKLHKKIKGYICKLQENVFWIEYNSIVSRPCMTSNLSISFQPRVYKMPAIFVLLAFEELQNNCYVCPQEMCLIWRGKSTLEQTLKIRMSVKRNTGSYILSNKLKLSKRCRKNFCWVLYFSSWLFYEGWRENTVTHL